MQFEPDSTKIGGSYTIENGVAKFNPPHPPKANIVYTVISDLEEEEDLSVSNLEVLIDGTPVCYPPDNLFQVEYKDKVPGEAKKLTGELTINLEVYDNLEWYDQEGMTSWCEDGGVVSMYISRNNDIEGADINVNPPDCDARNIDLDFLSELFSRDLSPHLSIAKTLCTITSITRIFKVTLLLGKKKHPLSRRLFTIKPEEITKGKPIHRLLINEEEYKKTLDQFEDIISLVHSEKAKLRIEGTCQCGIAHKNILNARRYFPKMDSATNPKRRVLPPAPGSLHP